VFAPVIGSIPVAALGGLMLNVAFSTMGWKESLELATHSLKSFAKIPKYFSSLKSVGVGGVQPDSIMTRKEAIATSVKPIFDFFAMLVTMRVCLNIDMGVGVLTGVVLTKIPWVLAETLSRLPLPSFLSIPKNSAPPQLV